MNSYSQGLIDEKSVVQILQQHHTVTPSTKEENILYDIDCYVDGVPVSIKNQHSASKSKDFIFELYVQRRDTKEWEKSWYYNSKAVYYIINVHATMYRIDKDKLVNYVKHHGFERYVSLSPKVIEEQEAIGHLHCNVKLGVVNRQVLLDNHIAERLPYVRQRRTTRQVTF